MAYSSNCESIKLKCSLSEQTYGPIEEKQSCLLKKSDLPKIHEQHANVTIDYSKTPDAEMFVANKAEIWYFPNVIQSTFPNLLGVEITASQLKKITAENLKSLLNLTYINLSGNEIKELDENLFQHNLLLTVVNLKDNQINKIHPTAFLAPQNIKTLDLINNICIGHKFDEIEKAVIIEKIKITCWAQYELRGMISDLEKQDSIIMETLNSQIKNLMPEIEVIKNISATLDIIIDQLSKNNISVKPLEAMTTTTVKPDSYIADSLNISLSSMIPIPFTPTDVSIVSCGFMTLIFLLLLCCICCRKAPKPIETLKTIVVKSSDYEKMKEMTTLRKSAQPITDDGVDHVYDVPRKNESKNGNNLVSESDGSFDGILEDEQSAVQTDWSVAYKTESDEKE